MARGSSQPEYFTESGFGGLEFPGGGTGDRTFFVFFGTFDIVLRFLKSYSRFIKLAAYPAPKPLSMFTTVTLLAQLLSIPSSAAKPWKLAP